MADVRISIRFFDDLPIRSVWDDETARWWMCASDVVAALAETTNPRVYWATVKRRRPELFADCKQLKLPARDGKRYKTDVIDDAALNALIAVLSSGKMETTLAYETDNDSYAFGYEFVRKATLREINFGERDMVGERLVISGLEDVRKGFKICRNCGKIMPEDPSPRDRTFYCKTWKMSVPVDDPCEECLFLYRELVTQAS